MPASDPTDEAAGPAYAAAGAIVRRFDRDAYFASYFLPKPKRHGLWAVLAFCQMIREAIASPATTLENAHGLRQHPAVVSPQHVAAISAGAASACGCGSEIDERVAMFRDRLAEIYDGRVELPAVAGRSEQQHAIEAVGRTVRVFDVPKQAFLDLAEGLRLDSGVRRYATWNRLKEHCQGVAGSVGVLVISVLGATSSTATEPATAIGTAIRLTNILRNLPADLQNDRVYLPLEDRVRHRVSEQDLKHHAGCCTPGSSRTATGVFDLIAFEVSRARELLRAGADGICWLADDGSRLAASAIVVRWSAALDAIESVGYDVFTRRPELSGVQKLRRLPAAWRLARRRQDQPIPRLH
jgi:phytoene synthase